MVPILKQKSHLPVIIDPSHATGDWRLVESMSLAAIAAGADGLIIEVHDNPEAAWSDGAQSLKPEKFRAVVEKGRKNRPRSLGGICKRLQVRKHGKPPKLLKRQNKGWFSASVLVGLKSASISLRETARPVTGPTGAAILPFPSRLRRAGAPTAKTRRSLVTFLTLRK